jgi:hypothetical protein
MYMIEHQGGTLSSISAGDRRKSSNESEARGPNLALCHCNFCPVLSHAKYSYDYISNADYVLLPR